MATTQMGEEKGTVRYRTLPVDICETSNAVIMRAEVPGVGKEDIEIGINGDELCIKGTRRPHDPGLRWLHGESEQGDYFRVFSISEELDPTNVEAGLSNGVLTLTLRKKPEILPRKIAIEIE